MLPVHGFSPEKPGGVHAERVSGEHGSAAMWMVRNSKIARAAFSMISLARRGILHAAHVQAFFAVAPH